nr:MAG TPA: hypothetical protein [Caudoviricetes sp.]
MNVSKKERADPKTSSKYRTHSMWKTLWKSCE